MNALFAPPPVSSTWLGDSPSSWRIESESRSAKQTPSSTARVMCARVCARLSPRNAPRIDASRCGVRSPWRYGRKVTPSAPGGMRSASALSRSFASPVAMRSRASWSRYQANAPPAESTTPIRYQVSGTTWQKVWARSPGSTRGCAVGASTVPDVPQLATASPGAIAPTPAAPHALSAPPPTTGVPSGSPVSRGRVGVTRPEDLGRAAHRRARGERRARRRRESRRSSAGAPCRTSACPTHPTARWRARR